MFWLIPIAAIGTGIYFFTRGKKGDKRLPKPGVVTLPFSFTVVDGEALIDITNAVGTYAWVTKVAVENGAKSDANASDVLRSVASSIPGIGKTPIGSVKFSEIDGANDEDWSEILSRASAITWGDMLTGAESWLQEKGLG